MNIIVFDIETIPDVHNGRRLYNFTDLTDAEVATAMFKIRRQESNGSELLRLHLHQIITISIVFRSRDQLKICSLGDLAATEKELIERFFQGIEKARTPTLISWNGNGFDLPVLHYRSLLHGVSAPSYWELGDNRPEFRWNNYLNRFHQRHLDLMDILAGYPTRANASLEDIALMLNLPGKMGMQGQYVWEYYQQGRLTEIRQYCETDVLNTYLVYLRFEVLRGKLTSADYQQECELLAQTLRQENQPHFQQFLAEWQH